MGGRNLFSNTYKEFQTDTIFAFDTSRSDDSLTHSAIDIKLDIKSAANISPKTTAFCLIIYEHEFFYSPYDAIVTRCV